MKMKETKCQFSEIQLPVPWGHVAAKAWGSSTGKPVLMIHGTLDNAGSFDRLIPFLPEEYYFVCIDLPGHGFSSHFPSGVPLEFFNYVHTIYLVLKALHWKTCICVGHSLGAQLAIFYSVIYPTHFKKIIALDGLIPVPMEDAISRLQKTYSDAAKTYNNETSELYTQEQMLHALKYLRFSALNPDAANALFTRAVTKVDNLYKYNRDPRMRLLLKPLMNVQQYVTFFSNFSVPIILLVSSSSLHLSDGSKLLKAVESMPIYKKMNIIEVYGNHDVHNNNPERVAPHLCKFLSDHIQSNL